MLTKYIILLLFTIITCLNYVFGNNDENLLYPIIKSDKWGYINQEGEVIITPKFQSAGYFREGLAVASIHGTYGYINTEGKFIIKPDYDFALPFVKGVAKVYLDGKPYLVDQKNKILFKHDFSEIERLREYEYSIVKTKSEKMGMINNDGALIIDTLFKELQLIGDFFFVTGLEHNPYAENEEDKKHEIGVLDLNGDWVIEFGKYRSIESLTGNFFLAERYSQTLEESRWTSKDAILNEEGKEVFRLKPGNFFFNFNNTGFYCERAIVIIYPSKEDRKIGKKEYAGIINQKGELVKSNNNWSDITPFVLNRAFVKNRNDVWFMIDREGNKVGDHQFSELLFGYDAEAEELFQNGTAMVKDDTSWVLLDTNGRIHHRFTGLNHYRNNLQRFGNTIFTEEDISMTNEDYSYQYGFWDIKKGKIIEPKFHFIKKTKLNDELIYVVENDRMGYIDKNGRYVWQEEIRIDNNKLDTLNIDFMNRGYFYASSPYKKELAGFGGWGGSENEFESLEQLNQYDENALQVIVDEKDTGVYGERYHAIKLYIINAAKKEYYFNAQDSRLYMNLQAKDKNGEWKDIEYLPSSWCGNSYHTLFLPSKKFWKFNVPVYEGNFKTQLRAKLLYMNNKEDDKNKVLYSNEFAGSINPGQFWRKREYYPSGIMDPYND